jgi:sugar fermentation stimulation protein A
MNFDSPLKRARLIQRYKRFLCDVRLDDGSELTAHIADPGRLPGLAVPGAVTWLSASDNPKRKLSHSVEMIEQQGRLVGVRPALANRLVHDALNDGRIELPPPIQTIHPEHRIDAKTRLDFMVTHDDGTKTFIEVKSASWREGDRARFPDAPTVRGRKHLHELAKLNDKGHRTLIIFISQRDDVSTFEAAADIDPAYAETLQEVIAQGVECRAYKCSINHSAIFVESRIA